MKKTLHLFGFAFIVIAIFTLSSCTKEVTRKTFPLSAEIFNSVVDKQVAFTALTHSAVSWSWDFGDGKTSSEKDPVHVYTDGGYYIATLTAMDAIGNSATSEVKLVISLTPFALLTGDHTADGYNGKTWKLTANHSANDCFAYANADFSVVEPLSTGILDLALGMGEVYDDEFTFHYDGSYSHDVKEDGAAFGGIVYQYMLNGGADIVNANGAEFGLCTATYPPEAVATFTYVENEDFDVPSIFGPAGILTYSSVSTFDFSGTEFVGFRDYLRKVIVQEITNNSMRLVMFMAADPGSFPKNTHALILTFEVVE